MRKVMVSSCEKIDGTNKWEMMERGEALFHSFSADYEELESGLAMFPVAIVEFPDGHVESVRAERIRFLTPNAN